ncbi:MAG: c-type cytochrome [Cyclobacteriaceae bacterium]|nr:c-type cytochrome [Cyclobacteriaceae bacterium]
MKNYINNKKYILLLMGFLGTSGVFAQGSGEGISNDAAMYIILGLVFLVALIVLGTAGILLSLLNTLTQRDAEKKAKEKGVEYVPEPSVWDKLNKFIPVEDEESLLTDHEYDGIRELDNHLPPWWLALFYITIVFGAIYIFGYHVGNWWPLQAQEYDNQMTAAAELKAQQVASGDVIDENSVTYNEDATFLGQGKRIYDMNCVACHSNDGGGSVGPNLTDNYWLHGGSIKEIFSSIKYGIPDKGMISWESSLSPEQLSQVSSYVYSLIGTTPANPKEAQGELVQAEGSVEAVVVESDSTVQEVADTTAVE